VQTENLTVTASVTTVLLSTTTRQISGYQNYQNGQLLLFSGQNFLTVHWNELPIAALYSG
jgi:hypothetical protein